MGNLKKKATIPLSLFYLKYFAYIFAFVLILAVTLLLVFNSLMVGNVVYPANQAERQAASAYTAIQEANAVTETLIPELCEYAVFDLDGNIKAGSLSEREADQAWKAVREDRADIGGYYFSIIPRDTEYCVLRYTFSPQYKSPVLRENLMEPQKLLFVLAISGTLLGIIFIAVRFGRALNKRLSSLVVAVDKVEQQELDFDISSSGIKEIDTILNSMDHMRTALKEALEKQWRTEQEKNRQMSALAHDLKTPLTIVRGNAELLVESNLPTEQKKYAEYIANSSLQMQNYVRTLIEVTKSWQGAQFRRQEVDCKLLFREIEQQARGLCSVDDISLCWTCNYRVKQISVDHDLFIRAIINVISNAVEHTPDGGTVTVSVNEEEDCFAFVVQDEGKGFSEEALKRGTEQFFMDDVSRNSKSHFGIGLYVAKSVVQKHSGQLILENSEETGGAKVTMYIPALVTSDL